MNPFDLSGPAFLVLYFVIALIVNLAARHYRHRAESGPVPKLELSDPYLVAYLRGGEQEVLKLGVVTLIDRGLLAVEGHAVGQADPAGAGDARNPLERELFKRFEVPTPADSIFRDAALRKACLPYRSRLEEAGLLPDASTRSARFSRCLLAITVLVTIGLTKVAIGVSRERPVSFLIILMIIAVVVTAILSFPRLTRRGQLALEDIQHLYGNLKDRAVDHDQGLAAPDMMMCAAVFGVAALAAPQYSFARSIFASSSPSIGSGCGSDGGGSSCGSSGGSSCSSSGGSSCGSSGCGGCGSSS